MNTRALAAKVLTHVNSKGASLTDALAQNQQAIEKSDQAFLQEICYGVTRWWWRLDAIINQLMQKPFKKKDDDLKNLAMIGLYQLQYMRVPDYAAVTETVNACVALKKAWAKKLINALLRNYQRQAKSLEDKMHDNVVARYSHPAWFIERLQSAWPENWQFILDANNQKPPMVIRVNLSKLTRNRYLEHLSESGILATEFAFNDTGLVLEKAVPVEMLPGFSEGWVSVQDGAAQLAADLLQLDNVKRVLDVCAAPGGKTTHILERKSALEQLVAVDIDPQRVQKIADNLQRLGLSANLTTGNALHPADWWDNVLFDRILLDAPCSATGVIRRHPDIKQLRRAADIQQLVHLQRQILIAVWPLLASGGMLLYATCSILPEENDCQIKDFIENHQDAKCMVITANWGVSQKYGKQIFPGQENMDGFYYACIQKLP